MSASQIHALSAIAFQLAAALESYEPDVDCLLGGPFDAEPYRRVSAHMDRMRMYAAANPTLAVPWVELMIRHFELMHGLWRVQQKGPAAADLRQIQAALRDSVRRLARMCTQMMPTA